MPVSELLAIEGDSEPANVDAIDADPSAFYALPTDPFVFVFDPAIEANWSAETIVPGDGVAEDEIGTWWVLTPRKLTRRLGLNGFRAPSSAKPGEATQLAKQRVENEGGIWLDPREHGYVARLDVLHPRSGRPGILHHEVFETPIKPARGKRVSFRYDRQRYLRWLLELHRSGVLPAPPDDLANFARARVITRQERVRADGALDAATRERKLSKLDADAAKIDAAASPSEPSAPVPARPRRGRKPGT